MLNRLKIGKYDTISDTYSALETYILNTLLEKDIQKRKNFMQTFMANKDLKIIFDQFPIVETNQGRDAINSIRKNMKTIFKQNNNDKL